MKLSNVLIIVSILSNLILSQPFDDPMKFFPANTGNMWEYFYIDPPYSDTLQTITINDSIDNYGARYIWNKSNFINPTMPPVLIGSNYFVIDNQYNVYGFYQDTIAILYKLNAIKGDQWVIRKYSLGYEIIRVDTVYEATVLGMPTQIKKYRNYYSQDSTGVSGLDRWARYLAYGLGVSIVDGLEGLGFLMLKGAIIDGGLYGDTTQVVTSVFDTKPDNYLMNFSIEQNFPNPFNSETNIMIYIQQPSTVSIIIYDILGNLVRSLVDNKSYYPGTYSIKWDGKDDHSNPLSSGLYFYKAYNNNQSILKKMILLK